MALPLKNASKTEKAVHGSWVVALIIGILPMLQTMWTEKPWWWNDGQPQQQTPEPVAKYQPVQKKAMQQQDQWQEPPASSPAPEAPGGLLNVVAMAIGALLAVLGAAMTYFRRRRQSDLAVPATNVE